MRYLYTLLLMCSSAFSWGQVNLNSGLAAYYPLNGNFNDASGNGNHGTGMGGISFTQDQWGNANGAADFDGSNDWVQIPASSTITSSTALSIAFRFKTNSMAGQVLMSKSGYSGTVMVSDYQYQIGFNYTNLGGSGLFFATPHNNACSVFGNSDHYTFSGTPIQTTPWYCVVMTFDHGVKSIYVNGVLAGQQTVAVGTFPNAIDSCVNSMLRLGTWWQQDPQYFNGIMDEVRLYNRALNTQEFDSLCNYNPTFIAGSLQGDSICAGEQAYLTFTATAGSNPYTITFTDGNTTFTRTGVQSGVPFPIIPSPTITTTYTLTSIQSAGSINNNPAGTATVVVLPGPTANAGPDIQACPRALVQLNGSGGGAYQWIPAAGLSNPLISNPFAYVQGPVTYSLVVTNDFGCHDTDQVQISLLPAPVANAGPDTVICPGASIQLQGSGGDTYKWIPAAGLNNPNIANPTATVTEPVLYRLVAMTGSGCSDTDEVLINIRPFPDVTLAPVRADLCPGDSVRLRVTGGDSHLWTPAAGLSDANASDPIASPTASTVYTVQVTDDFCNRSQSYELPVFVHSIPDVKAVSSNDIDCGNSQTQLSATGASSYRWTPVEGLESPLEAITIARPEASLTYVVTGFNIWGCSATDSVQVQVFRDGSGRLIAPNAFTPNGDGVNDCFTIKMPGQVGSFELMIYNRWGNRVYHSVNHNNCWDGKYKGQLAEQGTYYYYYKGNSSICGEVTGKGSVHLLR